MNTTDLAWAAGFIDGEGSIEIAYRPKTVRRSPVYAMSLRAANREIAPLEKLQSMFGGGIYMVSRLERRAVSGQWHLSGFPRVTAALKLLRPYLVVKGAHADKALEYAERCALPTGWNSGRGGERERLAPEMITLRQQLFEDMRRLNLRGEARDAYLATL